MLSVCFAQLTLVMLFIKSYVAGQNIYQGLTYGTPSSYGSNIGSYPVRENIQQGLPYGAPNPFGNNNIGGQSYQGIARPFPLIMDSNCKKYSCVPIPSLQASCEILCSPDAKTPQCPIFKCISIGEACGNLKCEVSTVNLLS